MGPDSVTAFFTDAGYAWGWAAVRRMPESVASSLFRSLADRTYERNRGSVQQLRANLARVRPDASPAELEDLVHEGMRRYLRYWLEAFRLPTYSPADIDRRFAMVIGEDRLAAAITGGGGVVVALPHMGNWDLAGAWVNHTHARLTTVAERLKPESLFDRFLEYRESLGMEVLPLTGGAPPFRTLVDRLRAGRLVALVSDRDLGQQGIPVDFFGSQARMPGGPAALAVVTGATLFPASMWVDGERTCCHIHPALEVPTVGSRPERVASLTQQLADVFEAAIHEYPSDWHMLQPLWTEDVVARAAAREGAA